MIVSRGLGKSVYSKSTLVSFGLGRSILLDIKREVIRLSSFIESTLGISSIITRIININSKI